MSLRNLLNKPSVSRLFVFSLILVLILPVACKKSSGGTTIPYDFDTYTTEKKMEYIMNKVAPDSVARFIYSASLGKIQGADTLDLSRAYLYAIENFKGEDLDEFTAEYDLYRDKLPLIDKMKFYHKEGLLDSLAVGLQLGLGYLASVRENKKNVKTAREEILKFKEACKNDSATYHQFIVGLHYALENDRGRDLDENIYNEFINFEDSSK